MAILTVNSDILIPSSYVTDTPRREGTKHTLIFSNPTAAQADIGSTFRLGLIPQHAVLLPNDSYIRCLPATTSLTVTLGWEAYEDMETGLTVAASPAGLGTALTIAAGTPVLFSAFPAAPLPRTFKGPAVLTCTTAGANILAAGVVSGVIVYSAHH